MDDTSNADPSSSPDNTDSPESSDNDQEAAKRGSDQEPETEYDEVGQQNPDADDNPTTASLSTSTLDARVELTRGTNHASQGAEEYRGNALWAIGFVSSSIHLQ